MTMTASGMDERDERKVNLRSSIESGLDGIETGALPMSQDGHGGNLPTGHAVAGVEGA
jgi:hypothetical protein